MIACRAQCTITHLHTVRLQVNFACHDLARVPPACTPAVWLIPTVSTSLHHSGINTSRATAPTAIPLRLVHDSGVPQGHIMVHTAIVTRALQTQPFAIGTTVGHQLKLSVENRLLIAVEVEVSSRTWCEDVLLNSPVTVLKSLFRYPCKTQMFKQYM